MMTPRPALAGTPSASDEDIMREAIALAKKGSGRTSPNPVVGALIVKGGKVIARGWHRKAGWPHAEVEALAGLEKSGIKAAGATLYVTLEPCCHFGKTPPCTDSIIRSGIKKVVTGATDPNPLVSGNGISKLRAAGIRVTTGVLAGECAALNEAYSKYIVTGIPFITLKLASTLDGRIATSAGESKWITGIKARSLVHRLRALNDAVMAGSNTIIKDDPELTVRLARGKNPVRVILDSALKTPLSAKVFRGVKQGSARLIIFTTQKATAQKMEKAKALGAEVIKVPGDKNGVDVRSALAELGKRGVTSVFAEGGGRLAATLLKAGLVDKLYYFIAPRLIGADGVASVAALDLKALKAAPLLKDVKIRKIGPDILVQGYLKLSRAGF